MASHSPRELELWDNQHFDVRDCLADFQSRFPEFPQRYAHACVERTIEYARSIPASNVPDDKIESAAGFQLAREILACVDDCDRAPEVGPKFSACCVLLSDLLDQMGTRRNWRKIDWDDEDEVRASFEAGWAKARYAAGEKAVSMAMRRARSAPIDVPKNLGSKFRTLVSLAYYLQKAQGEKPILLPVELLAGHFGVSAETISNLRFKAMLHGYIECVDPNYVPGKEAMKFRYVRRPTG